MSIPSLFLIIDKVIQTKSHTATKTKKNQIQ